MHKCKGNLECKPEDDLEVVDDHKGNIKVKCKVKRVVLVMGDPSSLRMSARPSTSMPGMPRAGNLAMQRRNQKCVMRRNTKKSESQQFQGA